jgi:exosortase/archaeosortase family protein
MESNEAKWLAGRYLALVVFGVGLGVFYFIFSPLTVYPVYWILKLLDGSTRLFEGNMIFFRGEYLEIVEACVAGAAYYLMSILNLSTPMSLSKRWKSVLFLLGSFLILNIFRIVFFGLLLTWGFEYFDLAHKMTWYFGSTVLVVMIWFANVWIFKIENIPIYSDARDLFVDAFDSGKKK